jgi:hypothetical protein
MTEKMADFNEDRISRLKNAETPLFWVNLLLGFNSQRLSASRYTGESRNPEI